MLVDALGALDAGTAAVADLGASLDAVLGAYVDRRGGTADGALDLARAADLACTEALVPLGDTAPDLACVFVSGVEGEDAVTVAPSEIGRAHV